MRRELDCVETEVNPEEVLGSEFKHLEIIGQGSGAGFRLKNLSLPIGWEKSIDSLRQFELSRITTLYSSICEQNGCSLESIEINSQRVLQKMGIKNNGSDQISTIAFSKWFSERQKGVYEVENLTDIRSAFVMQSIIAKHLNFFKLNRYSYVEGIIGKGFYPIGLEIPRRYFETKKPIINQHFQDNFINQAYNIAGRFGLNLQHLDFDNKGLLKSCYIDGDATGYYLENGGDSNHRTYCGHNVDRPDQAFALQTIVSSYLNHLI